MSRTIDTGAYLAKARAAVNAETFGTPEWETKMEVVRALVQAETDAAPKVPYTSIDGDIFAPRPRA
jgi:hypothetical protein